MNDRLRFSPAGLLTLSHEGYILEANNTFQEEMGYNLEGIVGQHIEFLCRPATKMIFHSYFYPNINMSGVVKELFIKLKSSEGTEVPFVLNARTINEGGKKQVDVVLLPMKRRMEYELELKQAKRQLEEVICEKDAALSQLEAIYKEIQTKQDMLTRLNSELLIAAHTDSLTGLANRKLLLDKLSDNIKQSQASQGNVSLVMIDIDYFKQVNDTYGHQMGDDVLIKVASLLQEFSRPGQLAGRFGGEEFLLLLPEVGKVASLDTAQRLKQLVEQTSWDTIGSLTVSIGVATLNEADSLEKLISKADQALYCSKENGRNQATHYDDIHQN